MRRIYKRLPEYDLKITKIAADLLELSFLDLDDWTFVATKNQRGWCWYDDKIITIPYHAIQRESSGYLIYYIAHELAHVFAGNRAVPHGETFMKWFAYICPSDVQHFEYGYKPRNAKRFGISR